MKESLTKNNLNFICINAVIICHASHTDQLPLSRSHKTPLGLKCETILILTKLLLLSFLISTTVLQER